MILEYHRPQTLEEALTLLARPDPVTLPMAGGSVLNQPSSHPFAVVDLQALGLNGIQRRGNFLDLGATLTLQKLLDWIEAQPQGSEALLAGLAKAIGQEAAYNLRQVASVAGTLASAGGRSAFTTALLALDASLTLQPDAETSLLGDLLPLRRDLLGGRLITQISLPLNASLAYQYVARTPADLPIVCAAAAIWPSGRTRLALGGFGSAPLLACDGTEAEGVRTAAESAYSQAGDQWASADYRREIAGVLAERAVQEITHQP